jgi:hypothetical protein
MEAVSAQVCISALAHWLNALRFHDAKLLKRVLHVWLAAARTARERRTVLPSKSNNDDEVLMQQRERSNSKAAKERIITRWSRISPCADRQAMQTRRPRTAMCEQLDLSNVTCIRACFRWIAVTSESKQQHAWRISADDAAIWHCDKVVRHYLIGRFQLRSDVDAVSQLLYAHALVNAQLVAASFTAWAAVLRTARKARVVVAKLRARRCLRMWSTVTAQQLQILQSCVSKWQQAVQRRRQLAAAAVAATAIHNTCAQRAAWTQWRAVAVKAVAVRIVQRVWRGNLGRKVAAKTQQQKLNLQAAKHYIQQLRTHRAVPAIQQWRVHTAAQQQRRQQRSVTLQHCIKRAQRRAICTWKQRTHKCAAVAAIAQRRAKAQAISAIGLWQQRADRSKSSAAAIATATARQRRCALRGTVATWRRVARCTRGNTELCAIVQGFTRLRGLSAGLQQWQQQWKQQCSHAEQLVQCRQRVYSVLAAVLKRVQRQTLSAWRARTAALRMQHAVAQQRRAVVVRSCAKRAMWRTQQQFAQAATQQQRVSTALAHRRACALTAAWQMWHSACTLQQRQRTADTTAAAFIRSRSLLHALRIWKGYKAVRKACSNATTTATAAAAASTAKRALAVWRRHAQWMIAHRCRDSSSAEWTQLRQKRNGLLTWCAYVARQVNCSSAPLFVVGKL